VVLGYGTSSFIFLVTAGAMFVEKISFVALPKEFKVKLLSELGYGVDGDYVIDKDKNRVKDKYIDKEVTVSNMLILPGSTLILDNNELSIAEYLEEHPNKNL